MSSKNTNPSYLYLEPKGEIITPFCMVFISRLVNIFNKICYILILGRTSKVIPPLWYKEGLMELHPWVFAVFQYFEEILHLIEGL